MAGWHHDSANWKPKDCFSCGTSFTPKSGVHKYCSTRCKEKAICGAENTPRQYIRISGRWDKYFTRLCNQKHRKGVISPEDCLAILGHQQGRCALSGQPLTCTLQKGTKTRTNASLDRIDPKLGYVPSNVQLVCVVLNVWRSDTPLAEYIDWCRKVVEHAEKTQL